MLRALLYIPTNELCIFLAYGKLTYSLDIIEETSGDRRECVPFTLENCLKSIEYFSFRERNNIVRRSKIEDFEIVNVRDDIDSLISQEVKNG